MTTLLSKFAGVMILVAAASADARAATVVGGFNSTRGGALAITDGAVSGVRNAITATIPGSTIVGTATLTPGFLAGIDILVIASPNASNGAITPLSAAEQAAVLAFVQGGGRAAIFTDNSTFAGAASDPANESLLNPFGLDCDGTGSPWGQPCHIVDPPSSPITNGPFGVVNIWTVGWSGWFTTVPASATVLGNVDQSGLPGIVVFPTGALAPGSGAAVIFSDTTAIVDGFEVANDTLIRNLFAFLKDEPCGLGDINCDGIVNGADIALVLGSWGTCAGCAADVSGDGIVDGADLAVVLGNWG